MNQGYLLLRVITQFSIIEATVPERREREQKNPSLKINKPKSRGFIL
jgi:hypothetical protein